jgi:hypothetical protein
LGRNPQTPPVKTGDAAAPQRVPAGIERKRPRPMGDRGCGRVFDQSTAVC